MGVGVQETYSYRLYTRTNQFSRHFLGLFDRKLLLYATVVQYPFVYFINQIAWYGRLGTRFPEIIQIRAGLTSNFKYIPESLRSNQRSLCAFPLQQCVCRHSRSMNEVAYLRWLDSHLSTDLFDSLDQSLRLILGRRWYLCRVNLLCIFIK